MEGEHKDPLPGGTKCSAAELRTYVAYAASGIRDSMPIS